MDEGIKTGAGSTQAEEHCRRRLAPEARRAEILQAALGVFAELGFERATLQDVADRAGVTKGALYHYFESKEALFLDVMRERVAAQVSAHQALVAGADPGTSQEALLRQLLESMWANLQQPDMLALTRLIITELPKFPEVGRSFFDDIVAPARQTLRRALDRSDTTEGRRREFVEAVVSVLPGMMLGAALTRHVFQPLDPADVGAERARAVVVEVLLRGAGDHLGPERSAG